MKKTIAITLTFGIAGLIIASCSGGKFLSTLSLDPSRCIIKDVVYQGEHQLTADIYYAKHTQVCSAKESKQPLPPTIVFIFGGSWKSGDKAEYSFVADAFVEQGYNVLIPNYRLYPDAAYPDFIVDLEAFMIWLHASANKMELNTSNLIVMGHSAGAYNTAMYMVDNRYKKPLYITAFIGLAGAYDFFLPTNDPQYIPIFTQNSTNYNSPKELPARQFDSNVKYYLGHALLLHGADDDVVTPKNLEAMEGFLVARGVKTSTKLYKNKGHAALVAAINNVPFYNSQLKSDVISFANGLVVKTQED